MIKLSILVFIFATFLTACGGGGGIESDTTPPVINVISPLENDTIFGGSNIELNIEISDNRFITAEIPKAVINWKSTIKKVDDSFSPWSITYTDEPIEVTSVRETSKGYSFNVKVSIPTKNEDEEYAEPGKYELNVWEVTDNSGNTIKRDNGAKVIFFIKFPPL